jgi:hypothetical protein
MKIVGRCGNYDQRPEYCRDYPQLTDFIPSGCTFHFVGEERRGECHPEVCQENNCCGWPREEGEPVARALDEHVGGKPCKFLVWEEREEQEKKADGYDDKSITNEIYETLLSCVCPRRS